MSDTVELQILSMPHSQMTTAAAVASPIRKQQPASKLANRYLSTAAQYLTRTRSFHVSSNKQNNGNTSLSVIQPDDLVRSIPKNMPTNNPSKEDLPVSPPVQLPSDGPTNSLDDNKSQGIVNTLRRSLRKSKERFYNKTIGNDEIVSFIAQLRIHRHARPIATVHGYDSDVTLSASVSLANKYS